MLRLLALHQVFQSMGSLFKKREKHTLPRTNSDIEAHRSHRSKSEDDEEEEEEDIGLSLFSGTKFDDQPFQQDEGDFLLE